MKALVVGAGGREHAITWALSKSPSVTQLFCSLGSDAIQKLANIVPISPQTPSELAAFAETEGIDLTVVGPEGPLAAGLCDEFRRRSLPVVGPSRAAAQLEASKIFAKEFMRRHSIPTARFATFELLAEALDYVSRPATDFPLVIKADGLAGGKGVAVCQDADSARSFLSRLMEERAFGRAGRRVVIEECLVGEEVSYMVLCDGRRHSPLAVSQDHKKLVDGDQGPNTGGMGAYSCDDIISHETVDVIEREIVDPTLAGMAAEGRPFQGVLYVGLMITLEGPRVLEFNVRLGDPETQAILMRFEGDWAAALKAAAEGRLEGELLRWHPGAALCIVVAAEGYPEKPQLGAVISGLEMAAELEQVEVFHAGTRFSAGRWETAGGRVLGVTARGSSLSEASIRAYEAVNRIHFAGMHYRRDIGAQGLAKLRSASRTAEG